MKFSVLSLFFLAAMLAALQASAVQISDVNFLDDNIITGAGSSGTTLTINERYGESTLVEYPSHDGYAIVNEQGGFFDKRVELNGSTGAWNFTFGVTNASGYDWSDYHFVFYNPDFTAQNTGFAALNDWSNTVIFLNSNYDQGELQFWAPAHHLNGETRT